MIKLRSFFSDTEIEAIQNAIQLAEAKTSGEIRVRIEAHAEKPMETIRSAFEKAGMRNTKLHNGVMFMLAVEDKIFMILGDDGIDKKVPKGFWDEIKDLVISHFQKGKFAQGLVEGIRLTGEQLAEYFPCENDDVNELSNSISFGDESES